MTSNFGYGFDDLHADVPSLAENLAELDRATEALRAALLKLQALELGDVILVDSQTAAELQGLMAILDQAQAQLREAAARLTDGPPDATVTP